MIERAVLFGQLKDLKKAEVQPYSRIYFGAEFCELKIPGAAEVKDAAGFAAGLGKTFTLVTPYVTDSGMKAVEKALEGLPDAAGTEIVVNDYGVLGLVLNERENAVPILGRLLSRQKRGFGISSKQADAGPALSEHWRASAFDSTAVRAYLDSLGIHRVELDNLPQGISSDFSGTSGLKASLYYPYGYVTTTRYCPWAHDATGWTNLKGGCGRACLRGMIEERGDVFARPLYISGNSRLYLNDVLPAEKDLLSKGIDRLVHEPEIPV